MSKKKNQVNYLSLFLLGIGLLTVGIVFTAVINPAYVSFMASGVLFMIIGLSKKSEWPLKKNENKALTKK
jgi:hypothetical protein